jgi:hypothetical protein
VTHPGAGVLDRGGATVDEERHGTGVLQVPGAAPTPVTLTLVHQPLARRVGRALLALAVFFPLAAAAAFIPLAHFVLVPGL